MMSGSGGSAVSGQVVADRLSVFARDIAAQCDRPSSIGRAVQLAPQVIDSSLTDIIHVRGSGRLSLLHSSAPDRSTLLIKVAEASGESPAVCCRSAAVPATIRDLDRDDRWPRYSRAAFEVTGLRSEMAIGLEASDQDCLVLRFFSGRPDAWSDAERGEAIAFAELTALAIDRVSLRETAGNLRLALESNRLIGAAIGMLMGRRGVGYDDAFGLLRRSSQNTNRRLADLADDVVRTGDLPESADGGIG